MFDQFFNREYDEFRYNCGHFVAEVWKELKGEDISGICCAFMNRDKSQFVKRRRSIVKLQQPEIPCLVLLRKKHFTPHIGILVEENQVLHITISGVHLESLLLLECHGYRIDFYK